MRLFHFCLLAAAVFVFTGCGTIHNLKDSPNGPMYIGMGRCYPFGGVARSGLLAIGGPPCGMVSIIEGNMAVCRGEVSSGFEQVGSGLLLTSFGLVAIADTPLSLAGDILTLPIVYARSEQYPWATWWGEKSRSFPDTHDEGMRAGNQSPANNELHPTGSRTNANPPLPPQREDFSPSY